MNILLTGGAGYIGSHVAATLAAAGHRVTCFDNLSNSDAAVMDRLEAITGAAIGTVAAVGGTLFALHSSSKHDESDRYCDDQGCSDERGVRAMHDAIVAGNRATACFVVAGVGLSVAGVLWFVRPFDADDPTSAQVGVGPGRVDLLWRW